MFITFFIIMHTHPSISCKLVYSLPLLFLHVPCFKHLCYNLQFSCLDEVQAVMTQALLETSACGELMPYTIL